MLYRINVIVKNKNMLNSSTVGVKYVFFLRQQLLAVVETMQLEIFAGFVSTFHVSLVGGMSVPAKNSSFTPDLERTLPSCQGLFMLKLTGSLRRVVVKNSHIPVVSEMSAPSAADSAAHERREETLSEC